MQAHIVQNLFNANNHAHPDAAMFPKIRKSCRSFKEVAEVSISQLDFLLGKGYLKKDGTRPGGNSTASLRTQGEENQLHTMEM